LFLFIYENRRNHKKNYPPIKISAQKTKDQLIFISNVKNEPIEISKSTKEPIVITKPNKIIISKDADEGQRSDLLLEVPKDPISINYLNIDHENIETYTPSQEMQITKTENVSLDISKINIPSLILQENADFQEQYKTENLFSDGFIPTLKNQSNITNGQFDKKEMIVMKVMKNRCKRRKL
jgi:hypothetical protein